MLFLRILLSLFLVVITAYTLIVIANDGLNLIAPFLGDVAAVGWPGQFNLDFLTYLLLSALWVAWRHNFSAAGIGLALVASVGGMLFLSVYLLVASFRAKGDIETLLLGERRRT